MADRLVDVPVFQVPEWRLFRDIFILPLPLESSYGVIQRPVHGFGGHRRELAGGQRAVQVFKEPRGGYRAGGVFFLDFARFGIHPVGPGAIVLLQARKHRAKMPRIIL